MQNVKRKGGEKMKTAYEKRWKYATNNLLFGKGLKRSERGFYFFIIFIIIVFGVLMNYL